MNIKQLTYFVKTLDEGNITRAAERLNVAQPALGLQIRLLEEALKVPLINRHSRGVTPTEAGKSLYIRARQILSMVELTKQEMASFCSAKESISFGMPHGLTAILGPSILEGASRLSSKIALSLAERMSSTLVEEVEKGVLDVVLSSAGEDNPTTDRLPVLYEDLLFITKGARDRPFPDTIEFEDILHLPLVLGGRKDGVRQIVENEAHRRSKGLILAAEVSSVHMMKRLTEKGDVHTVMPYTAISDELRSTKLSAHLLVEPRLTRKTYVVVNKGRRSTDAMTEFISLLFGLVQQFTTSLASAAPHLSQSVRFIPQSQSPDSSTLQ